MKNSDKKLIKKINEALSPIDEQNELPEALQPEKVRELLHNAEKPRSSGKNSKRVNFKYIASIAAAFVLILAIGIFKNPFGNFETTPVNDSGTKGIEQVGSYHKIESMFLKMQKSDNGISYRDNSIMESASDSMASTEKSSSNAATKGGLGASDYSETNLQVSGVDEADIFKNDGSYFYIVPRQQDRILIVKAAPADDMRLVSTIDAPKNTSVNALYILKDKLIAVCSEYSDENTGGAAPYYKGGIAYDSAVGSSACYPYYCSGTTSVYIYDIKDRSKPELKKSFKQDGNMISSRMVGAKLYVLSDYVVSLYQSKDDLKNNCIPKFSSDDGGSSKIAVADISILPDNENPEYLIVSAADIENPDKEISKKAVLGGSSDVYCTADALYASRAVYDYKGNTASCVTEIYKFKLSGGTVDFVCSGKVSGYAINQFALDEYDGYLRIATTENENSNGSNVFILDKELKTVGLVKGIAANESIYAVRFLKDKGYVVTFKQTDPLFVIDLSDPKVPKILGELKVPGFSEYLHPYSADLMIGIGRSADDSGAQNGLKISLFDISDASNPKELDNYVIKNAYTEVSYDHKAFLMSEKDGWFGMPVYSYDGGYDRSDAFLTFDIENSKIVKTGAYKSDDENDASSRYESLKEIRRGAYIGDTLYTVSDGCIKAFSLKTGEAISTLHMD